MYVKISQEDKIRLSNYTHIWELKEFGQNENEVGLGFTINDLWGPERFALMDAIETLEITEGEYQAICQTELYLASPNETKKMLSGMIRMPRYLGASNLTRSIHEGETVWFSKQIFSNVTLFVTELEWVNPEGFENNLSFTIYSPDRCVFGPFTNAETFSDDSQKMKIRTTIQRPNGVAEGEWWYCVKGVKVHGLQEFII